MKVSNLIPVSLLTAIIVRVEETMDSSAGKGKDESRPSTLSAEQASLYRAITARCNYLQPDRPDIQYAVKEVCRRMAKPSRR